MTGEPSVTGAHLLEALIQLSITVIIQAIASLYFGKMLTDTEPPYTPSTRAHSSSTDAPPRAALRA